MYLLILLSAIITASSQILLKVSANKKHRNIFTEYINLNVLISYIGYILVLFINVIIYTQIDYRYGVVINSLATIMIMILSRLILRERITKRRVIGNVLILIGIACFTLF